MQKELRIQQILIELNTKHEANQSKRNSFSSQQLSQQIQNTQIVDFEQYLRTEHHNHQGQGEDSMDFQQNQSEIKSTKNKYDRRLLIQTGQNYTFADERQNKKCKNSAFQTYFVHPLQMQRYLQNTNQQISPQLNGNFCQSSSSNFPHSQFSQSFQQHSKEISLSDNQQDRGVNIFKSNQKQEELFLKISEQIKHILKLEEKLYYYEDFCKRLLKNTEESNSKFSKILKEYQKSKKNLKQKDFKFIELQRHVKEKNNEIHQLKQEVKSLKKNSSGQQFLLQDTKNSKKSPERKILIQLPNLKNQQLNQLQIQHKILQQKYLSLSQINQNSMSKITLLQKDLQQKQKQNLKLLQKNKNLIKMNKILQKEITELNVKMLQLQNEIKNYTCIKYADNLTKIKNFNTTDGNLINYFSLNNQAKKTGLQNTLNPNFF